MAGQTKPAIEIGDQNGEIVKCLYNDEIYQLNQIVITVYRMNQMLSFGSTERL